MQVPPLRDRKEDIPLLVNHFVGQISAEQGRPLVPIEEKAIKMLQELSWSGNVRELHNVVERLLILCSGKITTKDVERYVKPMVI